MILKKNRKGIEAGGFSVVIGIILLLFTAFVIFSVIRYSAGKVDEKLQVDTCRISNEIKFGLEKATGGVLSSYELCNTIEKHKKRKSIIPTSKYKQDNEGAEAEIREMIKNCWHMWLDGSEPNMFKEYPIIGNDGCHTCYVFKIKDKDTEGVTFSSIQESLQETFFAKPTSDECDPAGGILRAKCLSDEKSSSSFNEEGSVNKCCIKKDSRNVCENSGGKCLESGAGEYSSLYAKWSCPERKENCYIEKDDRYSYIRYIREYGSLGGDIFFIPPEEGDALDINYNTKEVYAISFVSPKKVFCGNTNDALDNCLVSLGNNWHIPALGIGLIAAQFIPGVIQAEGAILQKGGGALIGSSAGLGLGAYGIYKLDTIGLGLVDLSTKWLTTEFPNFLMVSSFKDAKSFGCTNTVQ